MQNLLDKTARHLSYSDKTNLGSFYTPQKLVSKTYELLNKYNAFESCDVLLEPSCGYGAFFNVDLPLQVRCVGADIDLMALETAKSNFPEITFLKQNALHRVNRINYGISDYAKVILVGNPPYNDKTSHVKCDIKTEARYPVDKDIESRDIGLSSLLAYNKLKPEFVAVLHPLSYLIKKTNFNSLKPFLNNYKLLDTLVFSSQEFSEVSKMTGFPIVIAIYKKDGHGMTFKDVEAWSFKTLEGLTFSLNQFDYIDNYLDKYPSRYKRQNWKGFLFYTMRDINALKRSRTFIKEDIPNAVQVKSSKLEYYQYVDIFKDYAERLPYYMGNLNVPINNEAFKVYRKDFEILSRAKHPDIFGTSQIDDAQIQLSKQRVNIYFDKLFKRTILL